MPDRLGLGRLGTARWAVACRGGPDADRGVDVFCDRCMPAGETVSPERYQQIVKRWADIDGELAELWAGTVVEDADPAAREVELFGEQDALEFELGDDFSA
jgi:hypothetical protein